MRVLQHDGNGKLSYLRMTDGAQDNRGQFTSRMLFAGYTYPSAGSSNVENRRWLSSTTGFEG